MILPPTNEYEFQLYQMLHEQVIDKEYVENMLYNVVAETTCEEVEEFELLLEER